MRKQDEMFAALRSWAENHEQIRAVILGGSLANPNAFTDLFSDYDPMLIVTDIACFTEDDTWLNDFGSIITSLKSSFSWEGYGEIYTRLALYDDGVKIDFSIWPIEVLSQIAEEPILPDSLDMGYTVLLDKDGITDALKQPSYSAFVTKRPTEEEYVSQIDEFWWNLTYVAKCLWRDELYFAKYMLDYFIRFNDFKKVIEWYIGVEHNWTANPNKCGRWFKRYLDAKTWSELEETYAGASIEANWNAVFKTTDLFRKLAMEVGDSLGYKYPLDHDRRVTAYLLKVRALDKDAVDFV